MGGGIVHTADSGGPGAHSGQRLREGYGGGDSWINLVIVTSAEKDMGGLGTGEPHTWKAACSRASAAARNLLQGSFEPSIALLLDSSLQFGGKWGTVQ